MKILIALTASMLMATLLYGQNTQILVNEQGDTMVVTPLENIERANQIFLQRDWYKGICDHLTRQGELKDQLIEQQTKYINHADSIIMGYRELASNDKKIKQTQNEIITSQTEVIEHKDKKLKGSRTLNKVLGSISLVLLGIIILK